MFVILPRLKKIFAVVILPLTVEFTLNGLNLNLLPASGHSYDQKAAANADRMLLEGKDTFRYDTSGDENFWGNTLKLHQAVQGAA